MVYLMLSMLSRLSIKREQAFRCFCKNISLLLVFVVFFLFQFFRIHKTNYPFVDVGQAWSSNESLVQSQIAYVSMSWQATKNPIKISDCFILPQGGCKMYMTYLNLVFLCTSSDYLNVWKNNTLPSLVY